MRLKRVYSCFLFVLVAFIILAHSVKVEAASSGLRRVEVKDILVDQRNDQPVLLLQEKKGGKLLPIWIGPAEARAIYMELEEATPHRPMTHDLMRNLLRTLEAEVLRVVITELKGGTYFAFIDMKMGDKRFFGRQPPLGRRRAGVADEISDIREARRDGTRLPCEARIYAPRKAGACSPETHAFAGALFRRGRGERAFGVRCERRRSGGARGHSSGRRHIYGGWKED